MKTRDLAIRGSLPQNKAVRRPCVGRPRIASAGAQEARPDAIRATRLSTSPRFFSNRSLSALCPSRVEHAQRRAHAFLAISARDRACNELRAGTRGTGSSSAKSTGSPPRPHRPADDGRQATLSGRTIPQKPPFRTPMYRTVAADMASAATAAQLVNSAEVIAYEMLVSPILRLSR